MTPLRIGILGASRISDLALIAPARQAGHRLVAVAARDPERARQWAEPRSIERVHDSYADLLNDPEVEVVYNALPNSLHAPWNIAAIEAGKHVLSEKPFASNAVEAETVRAVGRASDQVVFEAFHYWYHPIFQRLLQIISNHDIGELRELTVRMSMPAPPADDLRWSWPLAGGCLMDLGCYAIHVIRSVAARQGGAPDLQQARAVQRDGLSQIDERVHLEFRLPSGATAVADATMDGPWQFTVTATGDTGEATIANFINVHQDDRLLLSASTGEQVELLGRRSTYSYQMDALTAAIRQQRPFPTDVDDAVVNMHTIDACYRAAGLPPRGGDSIATAAHTTTAAADTR